MSSHLQLLGGKTASLLNYRPWPDQLLNLIAFFKIKTKIVIFLKSKVYIIVSLRHHLLTGKNSDIRFGNYKYFVSDKKAGTIDSPREL